MLDDSELLDEIEGLFNRPISNELKLEVYADRYRIMESFDNLVYVLDYLPNTAINYYKHLNDNFPMAVDNVFYKYLFIKFTQKLLLSSDF